MSRPSLHRVVMITTIVLGACQSYDEPPLECALLAPGATVDVVYGGSEASQTTMQAAMDYAGVAAVAMLEATTQCTRVATDLGVSQSMIDAAFAAPNQDTQMASVCRLAADAVARARGADGIALNAAEPVCVVPPVRAKICSEVQACLTAGAAADDAQVRCAAPKVEPSPAASSAALARSLKTSFGDVLALRARLVVLAKHAEPLRAAASTVIDTRHACIAVLRERVASAITHVTSSQQALNALLAALTP